MRALKAIHKFVAGSSIISPIGLGLALIAGFTLPSFRIEIFCAVIALTFIASTFEKPI